MATAEQEIFKGESYRQIREASFRWQGQEAQSQLSVCHHFKSFLMAPILQRKLLCEINNSPLRSTNNVYNRTTIEVSEKGRGKRETDKIDRFRIIKQAYRNYCWCTHSFLIVIYNLVS